MTLPDAGALLLMLAVVVAGFGAVAAPLAARRGLPDLLTSAHRAAYVTAALLSAAVLILEKALLEHDFSLRFVAETTSRAMHPSYIVASLWGGQAGSLLFWCWVLTLLSAFAVTRVRRSYPSLYPDVLGTLLGTQLFFIAVLALVSSPFERLQVVPADGRGLNPLLLHDGMRIHPPFLLAGFVSFAIPFAFAVAALASGRLGGEWVRAVRRWTLLAWAIQGAGLLLGAWWAYHVLGWGGYWGWDPVENVALLPWLMATALLHSTIVQERRGLMRLWNVVLAMATFAFAVFGTFVVRSGILSSVHSFAQSPLGPFFFGFLGLLLIGGMTLVLYRLPLLRAPSSAHPDLDSLISREASILLNNWLLVGVAATTLWGTIFPLLSEALRGVKVAVGPQFFQQVNGPIFLLLFVLLAVGPPLGWRRTSRRSLDRIFRWPALAVLGLVVAIVLLGIRTAPAIAALAACALVAATVLAEVARGTAARRRGGEPLGEAFFTLVTRDRRRYGAYLAHVAIALLAVGVIGSSFFQVERSLTLRRGETAVVAGYALRFDGLYTYRGPDYRAIYAEMRVGRAGEDVAPGAGVQIQPDRRTYDGWESQPTTGVAIHTTVPRLDDVYVMLTGWEPDGGAHFRVFVNPLVALIWIGGGLVFVGALFAAWPATVAARALEPSPRPAARPSEALVHGA